VGTFADIPSDLAGWYARRLRRVWTTSVNEGLGFFLGYTALIFAAALQAYSCLTLRTADERRLDEFLQSDHQVNEEDRYASALSVVLSALRPEQRISQGTCPPDSTECARARNVVNTAVQMAELITARAALAPPSAGSSAAAGATVPPTDITDIETILGNNHLSASAAGTARVAVDRGVTFLRSFARAADAQQNLAPPNANPAPEPPLIGPPQPGAGNNITVTPNPDTDAARSAIQLTRCDPTVGPPGMANEENRRRLQFGLREALCQRSESDVSGLQEPEEIAELESSTPQAHALLIDRLNWAIGISFALEAALRANLFRPTTASPCSCCVKDSSSAPCARDPESRNFSAAYFVSVDSVLRYWRDETIDPIRRLPKNIHWAAREYFQTYERGATALGDEYVSQPYIDIAGAGIVQTICRAVTAPFADLQKREPPANVSPGPERQMRVAGVVCADLALRPVAVRSLVAYIQGGPFVSAGLVRIQSNGEAGIETTSDAADARDLGGLIDSPQWTSTFATGWTSGGPSRAPTRLKTDSAVWYVIPIARSGTGLLAVALHPALSSGVGRLFRWAWLGGTCGAALVLLTFTANQSRRVAVASRDLARLRGLAAAVIEVRLAPTTPGGGIPDQIIVAGNDRAQEVLHIALPNFGLSEGAKPLLSTLFEDDNYIPAKADGMTPQDALTTAREIGQTRKRGDTSTYFARLRIPQRIWQFPTKGLPAEPLEYAWVRVSGGPVILPRRRGSSLRVRGHLESTVAILQPILEKALSEKLDGIVASQSHRS
jgi:hypothetical protein